MICSRREIFNSTTKKNWSLLSLVNSVKFDARKISENSCESEQFCHDNAVILQQQDKEFSNVSNNILKDMNTE